MSWELNPNTTYNNLVIHGPNSDTYGYDKDPDISINLSSETSSSGLTLTATIHQGPSPSGSWYGFAFKVGVSLDDDDNPEDHILISKDSIPKEWSTNDPDFDKASGSFHVASGSHKIWIWFYGACDSCESHGHWRAAAWMKVNLSVTATFDPNDGKWWDGTTENKSVQVTPGSTPNPPGPSTNYISRTGYRFNGWNPELGPISSNETYKAKWQINSSILRVNPNGGTWNGQTTVQEYEKNYGYELSIPDATAFNYTITFKPNGGTWQTDPSTGNRSKSTSRSFDGWDLTGVNNGSFNESTKKYKFGPKDGDKDTMKATYKGSSSITTYSSSDIAQEGWLLKGWTDGTHLYGPGATVSPTANLTLTAVWKTSPIMKYDGTKWVPWVSPGSTLKNVDLVKIRNSSGSWEQTGKIYRYNGTSWVQVLGKEK